MSLRNYILNFNDVTKIGLNLTFGTFRKVSDDSSITPPVISELSLGFYKFTFDISLIDDDVYYVATDGGANIITGVLELDSNNSINNKLDRVLGLSQENQFIDQTVYDLNGSLLSARLRLYSTSSDVGTDNNVTHTYIISASYTGTSLDNYSCKLL